MLCVLIIFTIQSIKFFSTKIETDPPQSYLNTCHAQGVIDEILCSFGDVSSPKSLVLVGDSHAAQYLPALDLVGKANGVKVISFTMSSCPVSGLPNSNIKSKLCNDHNTNVGLFLKNRTPDYLVISNLSIAPLIESRYFSDGRNYATQIVNVANFWSSLAGKTIYIEDSPYPKFNHNLCIRFGNFFQK